MELQLKDGRSLRGSYRGVVPNAPSLTFFIDPRGGHRPLRPGQSAPVHWQRVESASIAQVAHVDPRETESVFLGLGIATGLLLLLVPAVSVVGAL